MSLPDCSLSKGLVKSRTAFVGLVCVALFVICFFGFSNFFKVTNRPQQYIISIDWLKDSDSDDSIISGQPTDSEPSPSNATIWDREETGARQVLALDGVDIAFRCCPAGTHQIGSLWFEDLFDRLNDESRRSVVLSHHYWMMETEVTQKMWQAVMGNNPSCFKGEELPVESVSWNDCQEFVKKLNEKGVAPEGWIFSLPTEAEWEVAARSGQNTSYPWGNTWDGTKANGKNVETMKTGSFAPNLWGIFDTAGNVWEWTLDACGDYPKTMDEDPWVKKGETRVIRGGSWRDVRYCRSGRRESFDPTLSDSNIGFRCALVRVSVRQR